MRQIKLILAALFLVSPFAANATLIEGFCDGTADATVTCDDVSSLEWLDLTETLDLSPNDFLADVGGWIGDGWLFATSGMVDQLFLNGGAVDLTGSGIAANAAPAALFVDLFGAITFGDGDVAGAKAYADFGGGRGTLPAYLYESATAGYFFGGRSNAGDFDLDTEFPASGIWAYRGGSVTVPEPGTLALLGIGLFGMGLARRNRKV